jgi:succinate---hydroxymethylglutarate CoA-transferase
VIKKIIETSDVVVENYIPGALKKYGLDYPTQAQKKPGLIYASITGKPNMALLM